MWVATRKPHAALRYPLHQILISDRVCTVILFDAANTSLHCKPEFRMRGSILSNEPYLEGSRVLMLRNDRRSVLIWDWESEARAVFELGGDAKAVSGT